ncbi:MAG: phosphodiester glycosidase family protein [Cytophagales bacterium]|nr:MAG: phosphodiester glycosidase family protein [Cytophagales bacterium]
MIRYLIVLFFPVFTFAQSPDSLRFSQARWDDKKLNADVVWRESRFDTLFGAKQNINLVIFRNKPRRMQIAFASAGDSLRKTSWFGQKHGATVALNGTFFDVKKGGSVDLIRVDGQTLDTTLLDKTGKRAEHRQAAITIHRNRLNIVYGGTAPRWDQELRAPNVMVTGPLLLLDGKPHPLLKNPFNDNRHPRSCACVTHDRRVIWLTADGRHANAAGLSLPELTRLMQWLGCRDAINLDGGGSTTLWLAGQGENGVVNYPSDGRNWVRTVERPVSNVLLLRSKRFADG